MMRPFHLGLWFPGLLSYGESSLIFIIPTTLAAGRVLFALTEKSTRVLITCIFLPFLSTNKTNHAQTLLLYHQGEGGVSDQSLSSVPVCVCRWKPWHKDWTGALLFLFGSISKQRQPPVYWLDEPQLDLKTARKSGLRPGFVTDFGPKLFSVLTGLWTFQTITTQTFQPNYPMEEGRDKFNRLFVRVHKGAPLCPWGEE